MAYNFTAEWRKGKENYAPDALSRNLVLDPQPHDTLAEFDTGNNPEVSIAELRAIVNDNQENIHLQDLRRYAEHDHEYQKLKSVILNGFPDHRKQLPEVCKRYWSIREHLTVDEDLIVYGCRLLIPSEMRQKMLAGHHRCFPSVR